MRRVAHGNILYTFTFGYAHCYVNILLNYENQEQDPVFGKGRSERCYYSKMSKDCPTG